MNIGVGCPPRAAIIKILVQTAIDLGTSNLLRLAINDSDTLSIRDLDSLDRIRQSVSGTFPLRNDVLPNNQHDRCCRTLEAGCLSS